MSKIAKILTFVGVACTGTLLYFYYRQRKVGIDNANTTLKNKRDCILSEGCSLNGNVEKKIIDGELNFQDVVSWFKNIDNLNQEIDTPFIAKADKFCDLLGCTPTKKNSIFIGVYNNKSEIITHALLIETDHLDSKTKEILGNESLVVLQ